MFVTGMELEAAKATMGVARAIEAQVLALREIPKLFAVINPICGGSQGACPHSPI
jgi:hypothetical protein